MAPRLGGRRPNSIVLARPSTRTIRTHARDNPLSGFLIHDLMQRQDVRLAIAAVDFNRIGSVRARRFLDVPLGCDAAARPKSLEARADDNDAGPTLHAVAAGPLRCAATGNSRATPASGAAFG